MCELKHMNLILQIEPKLYLKPITALAAQNTVKVLMCTLFSLSLIVVHGILTIKLSPSHLLVLFIVISYSRGRHPL